MLQQTRTEGASPRTARKALLTFSARTAVEALVRDLARAWAGRTRGANVGRSWARLLEGALVELPGRRGLLFLALRRSEDPAAHLVLAVWYPPEQHDWVHARCMAAPARSAEFTLTPRPVGERFVRRR